MNMMIVVLRAPKPSSLTERNRRFGGAFCLRAGQGEREQIPVQGRGELKRNRPIGENRRFGGAFCLRTGQGEREQIPVQGREELKWNRPIGENRRFAGAFCLRTGQEEREQIPVQGREELKRDRPTGEGDASLLSGSPTVLIYGLLNKSVSSTVT
jgi:hypothetical protein